VEQIRFDLAGDLLDDVRRLDAQLTESHKRIAVVVRASSTTVTDLFGVGPMTAAILIGNTGDIRRFRNRDHFAAYTGTAPVEFSSGGRIAHRLSRRGNRTLNAAIHMAAITSCATSTARAGIYFETQNCRRQDQPQGSAVTETTPQQRHLQPTRR